MLNGIAPLFIFTIPADAKAKIDPLDGVPILTDGKITGIPIPIYLDENLTGIYIDQEEKSIDIDNEVIGLQKNPSTGLEGTTKVKQNPIESLVTIHLIASKSSIILTVLLALSDLIFSKAVSGGYGISYLNGPTTMFNGLLKTFVTAPGSNDTLMRITIQLSKANSSTTRGLAAASDTVPLSGGTVQSATPGGANGGNILVPKTPASVPIGPLS